MPDLNQFRHQLYPTEPGKTPRTVALRADVSPDEDFSRLHSACGVSRVILVHGTFVGDDPLGVAELLNAVAESLPAGKAVIHRIAAAVREKTRPLTSGTLQDVANYHESYRQQFQELVGPDPIIELPDVAWSSQNHHRARADLAVRLLERLIQLAPAPEERILLWGHSHAGNAFALLSNLLANDTESVREFFAVTEPEAGAHWNTVRTYLAGSPSPAPLAKSVIAVTFGTPVRYGWDTRGIRSLTHVLHHREPEPTAPFRTVPLFPPHSLSDMLSARYGDWVQAFAIVGTDTTTLPSSSANVRLGEFLERNLPEPQHGLDTKFLRPARIRNVCARWKTGTRCHTDGVNLLVDYEPSGRLFLLTQPIEQAVLGHGVATTVTWLPAHLKLVLDTLTAELA